MDLLPKLYIQRAQNELNLSIMIMKIIDDKQIQISIFKTKEDTYYSAAISHAYYCIFYAAKAYLLLKEIKTEAPEEHKMLENFPLFYEWWNRGGKRSEIRDFRRTKNLKNFCVFSALTENRPEPKARILLCL